MDNRQHSDESELTVCICTFRRPSLLAAIESVAQQTSLAGINIRILVIDNDSKPTAHNLVTELQNRTTMPLDYRHVPGQNISTARNAGLDAAATSWLAFLDDDEYASKRWLADLIACRNEADAVFGPCEAIYDDRISDWIKQGDYHSNRITESKRITTGYTSNVLIDMRFVRQHKLRFETALGRTGGEDTMFFHAMYRKGGVLKYAPSAVVYERVVPSRANATWIVRRRYRAGQVRALVFRKFDSSDYLQLSCIAPLKVVTCAAMALVTIPSRRLAMWWLMRGVFHFGTISYALGAGVHEEYDAQGEST